MFFKDHQKWMDDRIKEKNLIDKNELKVPRLQAVPEGWFITINFSEKIYLKSLLNSSIPYAFRGSVRT